MLSDKIRDLLCVVCGCNLLTLELLLLQLYILSTICPWKMCFHVQKEFRICNCSLLVLKVLVFYSSCTDFHLRNDNNEFLEVVSLFTNL